MTLEEPARLLRRYVQEVWSKHNADAVDEFLAPDYHRHLGVHVEPLTRVAQKELLAGFLAAFPDAVLTVEDLLVDADLIAFRSTMRGTHLGVVRGIQPTGTRVEVRLLDMVRIEHGKFAEQWGGPDMLDLLQQLGASVSIPDGDI